MNKGYPVLFRCDGSQEIGLGHIVRCLALADEFRHEHGCRVFFAIRQGPPGLGMVREQGYQIIEPAGGGGCFDYHQWIEDAVRDCGARALILDVRDDLPVAAIQSLRRKGVVIATIDDPSERRLAADLAFYPPVHQVQNMDWTGFTGQLFVGWEWVILRKEFARHPVRARHEHPLVLVTMGGSDPACLTIQAMEALDLIDEEFETIVLLGPGFCHVAALEDLLTRTRRQFDVRRNIQDMAGLMAQANLAVASFGVTAYELAAMGVPAIYLCLTEDHSMSASGFVEASIAINLGKYDQVAKEVLAHTVLNLVQNLRCCELMSMKSTALIDGYGVQRTINKILWRMAQRQ